MIDRIAIAVADYPIAVQVVLILAGALVVAKLLEEVARRLAGAVDPDETTVRGVAFEEIQLPLYVSVFLWGVYESLRLVSVPALGTIESIVLTAIVVLWARAFVRTGNRGLERVKERERNYEFAPVLKNVWSVAVVATAAIALLLIWEIDVTPLLASAGIIGIVLGFAARDAVANFIGGIALYFDDTYKLGDFIVLETGEKGNVVDIGLRSTTLLTRDRVMITVPNSVLNSSRIVNESAPQRHKRISVPVSVAYGTDTDRVEELLLAVADEARHVIDAPAPRVQFEGFGDDGIEYQLRAFVPHPNSEPRARSALNAAIYRRFEAEGIEIPYPQRDIRYRSETRPAHPDEEGMQAPDSDDA